MAADLETLVGAFSDSRVEVATLAVPIEDERDARAPDVVKVVLDEAGDALYFSRAAIPDRSHAREGSTAPGPMWRHVGVYAFRPAALARFCALPAGAREEIDLCRRRFRTVMVKVGIAIEDRPQDKPVLHPAFTKPVVAI